MATDEPAAMETIEVDGGDFTYEDEEETTGGGNLAPGEAKMGIYSDSTAGDCWSTLGETGAREFADGGMGSLGSTCQKGNSLPFSWISGRLPISSSRGTKSAKSPMGHFWSNTNRTGISARP